MEKKPNMKLIGLFICFGILCLALLFGYFLKSKYDSDGATVVMYFDESVKGLDVGAPVLLKGVKIGEVSEVKLLANLQTMEFLISVYAKIYHGKSLVTKQNDRREELERFIKEGLRAKLAINSVITGQLLIELDMLPNTKVVLRGKNDDIFEIPTLNSPFAEISKSFQIMPVAKIAQDINRVTEALGNEMPPLLNKLNDTLGTINSILTENKNDTSNMIKGVGNAANSLNNLMGENSASISTMIDSFSGAAQSMKNLTDYLQMNPSAIITGKEY